MHATKACSDTIGWCNSGYKWTTNWNQKTRNLRTSHQILHIYRDYSVHWCFSDNVSVPPPPAHKEATFVTQNTTTTAESNNNNINNNNNKEMFTVSPFSHQSVHLQTVFFSFPIQLLVSSIYRLEKARELVVHLTRNKHFPRSSRRTIVNPLSNLWSVCFLP